MTMSLSQGEGHFIRALAVHTHENREDRLAAGTLAVTLIVAAIILLVVAWFFRARRLLVTILLAAVIAGGAVALWNPWKNDWFFIGVRPEAARGGPMPIPSATPTYESPQFSQMPPGPYVESLDTATVEPRGEIATSTAPGPVVFLVLEGRAEVTLGGEEAIELRHRQATLVQPGESFSVANPGDASLRLLRFAVSPEGSS
jgi:hypothetical protein